jgi:hypothetical protein
MKSHMGTDARLRGGSRGQGVHGDRGFTGTGAQKHRTLDGITRTDQAEGYSRAALLANESWGWRMLCGSGGSVLARVVACWLGW